MTVGRPPRVVVDASNTSRWSSPDEDVERLLDGVAARPSEEGTAAEAIDIRVAHSDRPQDAIAGAADEFDVVGTGETDPSLVTFVFETCTEQVADWFLGPVVVIQRKKPSEDGRDDL